MWHRNLLLIVLAVVGLAFAACRLLTPQRSCDEITAPGLRGLMEQSLSSADMRSRITALYHLSPDQVREESSGAGIQIRWTKDGVDVTAELRDSRIWLAEFYYRERPPSAEHVIDCIHEPDSYWARYRSSPSSLSNALDFELYFLSAGVLAIGQLDTTGKQAPRPSGTIAMNDILVAPVDSRDKTFARLTEIRLPAELVQQIKPWPGKWENLVVEIGPAMPE